MFKPFFTRAVVSGLLLAAASFGFSAEAARVPLDDRAMEFELKDQFGKILAYRFPKDKVSVLTFGDRKGSSQIEGWVRPIWERYQDRIDLHGVAVLDSIPSLFRGFARGQFRKKVKYPVLLDFEGNVSKGYGYDGDRANVYVIDRTGRITLKIAGAASQNELERVYREIDRLLSIKP